MSFEDFPFEFINLNEVNLLSQLKVLVVKSKFKNGKKTDFLLSVIESMDIGKISQEVKKIEKNNFIIDLYFQV